MGWDNTTEQTASVVDALNILTRHFVNANSEKTNSEPIQRVPRPYEAERVPDTITLADLGNLLREQ
jgi:hypothetical protein